MIVTLTIKAEDLTLAQVLDKFSKQYKVGYNLKREDGHFRLRIKTEDLGELVRRLNHIKDCEYKIEEVYRSLGFSDRINVNITKTNVDALLGKTTTAQTDISPIDGGMVKVVGEEWFSRPQSDETIRAGTAVRVVGVEGVSLIVEEVTE